MQAEPVYKFSEKYVIIVFVRREVGGIWRVNVAASVEPAASVTAMAANLGQDAGGRQKRARNTAIFVNGGS